MFVHIKAKVYQFGKTNIFHLKFLVPMISDRCSLVWRKDIPIPRSRTLYLINSSLSLFYLRSLQMLHLLRVPIVTPLGMIMGRTREVMIMNSSAILVIIIIIITVIMKVLVQAVHWRSTTHPNRRSHSHSHSHSCRRYIPQEAQDSAVSRVDIIRYDPIPHPARVFLSYFSLSLSLSLNSMFIYIYMYGYVCVCTVYSDI